MDRSFIANLKSRIDIQRLVGEYVQLKKRGNNFTGLCPFHNEKTPSFTVSESRQQYHCFGCGKSGDVIEFFMQMQGLEFFEAVKELAAREGMEIPQQSFGSRQESDKLKSLANTLKVASVALQEALFEETKNAKTAIEELKSRGYDKTDVQRFCIGFLPRLRNASYLANTLGDEHLKPLLELGIVKEGEDGRRYDLLGDRIIFPIRDRRGQVVGFSGRVLQSQASGTKKNVAKYINSPESPIFKKSELLYGIDLVKTNHIDSDVFLVEGYTDVIALYRVGIKNAVASMGTAFTKEQASQIFKFTQSLVLCFDSDTAGDEACWKAIEVCAPHLRSGKNVSVVRLTVGADPDSIVTAAMAQAKNPSEALKSVQKTFQGKEILSEFLTNEYLKAKESQPLESVNTHLGRTLRIIASVKDEVLRGLLLQKLQQESGLSLQLPPKPKSMQGGSFKPTPLPTSANRPPMPPFPTDISDYDRQMADEQVDSPTDSGSPNIPPTQESEDETGKEYMYYARELLTQCLRFPDLLGEVSITSRFSKSELHPWKDLASLLNTLRENPERPHKECIEEFLIQMSLGGQIDLKPNSAENLHKYNSKQAKSVVMESLLQLEVGVAKNQGVNEIVLFGEHYKAQSPLLEYYQIPNINNMYRTLSKKVALTELNDEEKTILKGLKENLTRVRTNPAL